MAYAVPALWSRFAVDMLRRRNSAVDKIFYNVSQDDENALAKLVTNDPAEGSIIYVPPDSHDLVCYPDAVAFLDSPESKETGAIAIAGLGSSVLGSMALARDVATALQVPVAAVVAGYGLSDVMLEGFGGAFTLRGVNHLEFILQQMSRTTLGPGMDDLWMSWIQEQTTLGGGPDLATLKSLIRCQRLPHLRWLVGHSKGSLLIACAMSELAIESQHLPDKPDWLAQVNIVLFSAVVYLPNVGYARHQIIGGLDWLGGMNSRLQLPHKTVPGAWHWVNRSRLCYLDVVAELSALDAQAPPQKLAKVAAARS